MVWSRWFDLTPTVVANEAPTSCGVFCVARKGAPADYPAAPSSTVLMGAASNWQRGLRAVLGDLAAGTDGELEREGKDSGGLRFCFQGNLGAGTQPIYAAVLADFVETHGGPPRCNGRAL